MDMLGVNAFQTAKKAGLGDSFVRDILRGKTRSPSADNLNKLASALETTPDQLMTGGERSAEMEVGGLVVLSDVTAGIWLEVTTLDEIDDEDRDRIPAARDRRFPRARQYALRVRGDSMDEEFPDGSYVTCVDFWETGLSPRAGLTVHVERTRAGGQLVEITLKMIESIDGQLFLVPKSSNPKWKPVPIDGTEDTEVKIKGLVTGGWKPTAF